MATETGSCDVEAASSEDDEYLPEYNVTKGNAQGSSSRLSTPIAVVTSPSNQISTQTASNTSTGHQPCFSQQTAMASDPCTGHQSYKSVYIAV